MEKSNIRALGRRSPGGLVVEWDVGKTAVKRGHEMKITLCGSLRFENDFHFWNEKLSFAGHIVYDCSIYPSWKQGNKDWYTADQKTVLDMLHLAKIEESNAIVVLNVDGYIGES